MGPLGVVRTSRCAPIHRQIGLCHDGGSGGRVLRGPIWHCQTSAAGGSYEHGLLKIIKRLKVCVRRVGHRTGGDTLDALAHTVRAASPHCVKKRTGEQIRDAGMVGPVSGSSHYRTFLRMVSQIPDNLPSGGAMPNLLRIISQIPARSPAGEGL